MNNEGPKTEDEGLKVAASGWGVLYEANQDGKPGECFTTNEGPEMFRECRDWFIQDGEIQETDDRCITNRDPPSSNQKECQTLHKEIPSAKSQLAKVKVEGEKTVSISRSALFLGSTWKTLRHFLQTEAKSGINLFKI